MGSDFLKKTKQTIMKHIDRQRAALASPDLLTSVPTDQARCWVASVEGAANLPQGSKVMAEVDGNAIRLRQGNSYFAKLDNPTPDILSKISAAGGAGATIERVLKLSGKVEISLW